MNWKKVGLCLVLLLNKGGRKEKKWNIYYTIIGTVASGVCSGGKSGRTVGNSSGSGISRGAGRSGNGRKSSGLIRNR